MTVLDQFTDLEIQVLAGILGFVLALMLVRFIPVAIFIFMLPFLPKKGPLKK